MLSSFIDQNIVQKAQEIIPEVQVPEVVQEKFDSIGLQEMNNDIEDVIKQVRDQVKD